MRRLVLYGSLPPQGIGKGVGLVSKGISGGTEVAGSLISKVLYVCVCACACVCACMCVCMRACMCNRKIGRATFQSLEQFVVHDVTRPSLRAHVLGSGHETTPLHT